MTKNTDKAKEQVNPYTVHAKSPLNTQQPAKAHSFERSEVLTKGSMHPLCAQCGLSEDAKTHKPQPQHSPLPWSADKWATGYTISATDHSVCHLQDCNNDEANARLIVASVNHADKLAEALSLIAQRANFMLVRNPQDHQADYIMQQANNAIRAYEAAQ